MITQDNHKERICIYLLIDPKVQRDLQRHMIFYITSTWHGLPRSLWPNFYLIQREIRKISAIFIFFVGRSHVTVYIDIKRHVCARMVIVFSQVIKYNNIKAAHALRIQLQVYTGHFVGGLTRRHNPWLWVAGPLFSFYNNKDHVIPATRCAWENNNYDILISTSETTVLSRKKILAWYTFLLFNL